MAIYFYGYSEIIYIMPLPDHDSQSPEKPHASIALANYYKRIGLEDAQPVDILLSLEQVLKSIGMIDDSSVLTEMQDTLFMIAKNARSVSENATDQQAAKWQYALLPLRFAAQYVNATMNMRDHDRWYEKVSEGILASFEGLHTVSCIEERDGATHRCLNSEVCPLMLAGIMLTDGVRDYNFEDVGYIVDPLETYEAAMHRHYVAVRQGFVDKKVAEFEGTNFSRMFAEKFGAEIEQTILG